MDYGPNAGPTLDFESYGAKFFFLAYAPQKVSAPICCAGFAGAYVGPGPIYAKWMFYLENPL